MGSMASSPTAGSMPFGDGWPHPSHVHVSCLQKAWLLLGPSRDEHHHMWRCSSPTQNPSVVVSSRYRITSKSQNSNIWRIISLATHLLWPITASKGNKIILYYDWPNRISFLSLVFPQTTPQHPPNHHSPHPPTHPPTHTHTHTSLYIFNRIENGEGCDILKSIWSWCNLGR